VNPVVRTKAANVNATDKYVQSQGASESNNNLVCHVEAAISESIDGYKSVVESMESCNQPVREEVVKGVNASNYEAEVQNEGYCPAGEYVDGDNFKNDMENSLQSLKEAISVKINTIEKCTESITTAHGKRINELERGMQDIEKGFREKLYAIEKSSSAVEDAYKKQIRSIEKATHDLESVYLERIDKVDIAARKVVEAYAKSGRKAEKAAKVYQQQEAMCPIVPETRPENMCPVPAEKKPERKPCPIDISLERNVDIRVNPGPDGVSVIKANLESVRCKDKNKVIKCHNRVHRVEERPEKNNKTKIAPSSSPKAMNTPIPNPFYKLSSMLNADGKKQPASPAKCIDPSHYKVELRGMNCSHTYYSCLTCATRDKTTAACPVCGIKAWQSC